MLSLEVITSLKSPSDEIPERDIVYEYGSFMNCFADIIAEIAGMIII